MTTEPHPTSKVGHLADDSTENRRRAFLAMLREAEEEGDRDGTVTLEEVVADIERIIAEARR